MTEKINIAIEIFKSELIGAKGKFRPRVSETNANEIEFWGEDGLYCVINIRSRKIKGI